MAKTAMLPSTNAAMAGPALHDRQVPTSSVKPARTVGYRSVSEERGSTIWSPMTYYAYEDNPIRNGLVLSSSNDFFYFCYLDYTESLSRYVLPSTLACPFWTTCSVGTLYGASTSLDCWGASDPLTSLDCALKTDTTLITITSYFKEKPPYQVSVSRPTPANNTASTTTSSPTIAATTSAAATSITPIRTPTPLSPSHVKIIAGSVIGGIVGLAFAAVASLLILKHFHDRSQAPVAPAPHHQSHQPDNAPDVDVPEWLANTPARFSAQTWSPAAPSPKLG
ncbi:hypothetical protein K505DRAFT_339381 [Melanomma pulvis-pyrius CBS 109.77]|uniref:Mid2 domain-containing protein n=1 Tax=Melanomma pulvis-pyrius CBS 109.77 TaxID=1314802 RepID=A0A6A6X5X0_9PLEO|nr:hypothetical protein K505DRAFT_339381 [Melanomma pulvis-pyrius CBS 109.77]